jgi:hypothetical protein
VALVSAVSSGWTVSMLVSAQVYWLATGLAFLGWAGMWFRARKHPASAGWSIRLFLQQTLAATVVFLAVVAVVGSKVPNSDAYGIVSMREDLRELLAAQDAFFADSGYYSLPIPPGFRSEDGLLPPEIERTPDGWIATVGRGGATRTCSVHVGSTPLTRDLPERQVECTRGQYRISNALWGLGFVGLGMIVGVISSLSRPPSRE